MGQSSFTASKRKKEMLLHSLEANLGNVSKACKFIKVATSTYYRWMKEDMEFAERAENLRDISYRNLRDHLLDAALQQVEKGNASVLNKLLSIYFKNVPEDMKIISRLNNVPTRMTIKWVSTPQDPRREGYVKPPEQGRPGG